MQRIPQIYLLFAFLFFQVLSGEPRSLNVPRPKGGSGRRQLVVGRMTQDLELSNLAYNSMFTINQVNMQLPEDGGEWYVSFFNYNRALQHGERYRINVQRDTKIGTVTLSSTSVLDSGDGPQCRINFNVEVVNARTVLFASGMISQGEIDTISDAMARTRLSQLAASTIKDWETYQCDANQQNDFIDLGANKRCSFGDTLELGVKGSASACSEAVNAEGYVTFYYNSNTDECFAETKNMETECESITWTGFTMYRNINEDNVSAKVMISLYLQKEMGKTPQELLQLTATEQRELLISSLSQYVSDRKRYNDVRDIEIVNFALAKEHGNDVGDWPAWAQVVTAKVKGYFLITTDRWGRVARPDRVNLNFGLGGSEQNPGYDDLQIAQREIDWPLFAPQPFYVHITEKEKQSHVFITLENDPLLSFFQGLAGVLIQGHVLLYKTIATNWVKVLTGFSKSFELGRRRQLVGVTNRLLNLFQ